MQILYVILQSLAFINQETDLMRFAPVFHVVLKRYGFVYIYMYVWHIRSLTISLKLKFFIMMKIISFEDVKEAHPLLLKTGILI